EVGAVSTGRPLDEGGSVVGPGRRRLYVGRRIAPQSGTQNADAWGDRIVQHHPGATVAGMQRDLNSVDISARPDLRMGLPYRDHTPLETVSGRRVLCLYRRLRPEVDPGPAISLMAQGQLRFGRRPAQSRLRPVHRW